MGGMGVAHLLPEVAGLRGGLTAAAATAAAAAAPCALAAVATREGLGIDDEGEEVALLDVLPRGADAHSLAARLVVARSAHARRVVDRDLHHAINPSGSKKRYKNGAVAHEGGPAGPRKYAFGGVRRMHAPRAVVGSRLLNVVNMAAHVNQGETKTHVKRRAEGAGGRAWLRS